MKKPIRNLMNQLLSYDLYKQGNIVRWAGRHVIIHENDAEHMHYVTQLTMILCKHFEIDEHQTLLACQLAATHDWGETITNDVNFVVKRKNPAIKEGLDSQEFEFMKTTPLFEEYSLALKDELVKKIVDCADAIDVLYYINREKMLGNKTDIVTDVWNEAEKRVMNLLVSIKNLKEKDV